MKKKGLILGLLVIGFAACSGGFSAAPDDEASNSGLGLAADPSCNELVPTVTCTGGACLGTTGDDVIYGSTGYDSIAGLAGNDNICAIEGDDDVFGDPGNDNVQGGQGNDWIRGGTGDDDLGGNDGDDQLDGQGHLTGDACKGNAGADTFKNCELQAQ